ncbi:MAG TPA: D-alanyl-D-alanine carboxypeptidase family protein [Rhodopila sp.]|uniref:D-alanyl-D-alanine carboxypeptidase family protein n=1 Tax=Rhodopila sp. TaxID=2480087 RepID=UPI002CA7B729|nr:D-alanyl-D-alanine carboxypeptidase family protein [Rhodopila sp.]HVY18248.1 D-alanyl-D-alanine carboxypeptidase family protein [Rhodopila sp.]
MSKLTRRTALFASVALVSAPALAQPKRGARAEKVARKGKDADPTGSPADTPLGPVDTTARWAYAMDYNTGATLLDKQGDDEMPPSSMTKLMTLYIVYSRLKEGRLKLDDELPVSEKAWRMQGSKMFVQVGTSVRVEDLIRGVVVDSGNDAAIVLAEAIGGSEEQFVEIMNATAKKLGLTHSYFKNCTGWPDPEHHMSCHDIAVLAAAIIREFPMYYHYDSEKTFKYNGIEQQNRNPMVQKGTADGLKTGHTEAGGYGVVASSLRNGRRVILVLNGMATNRERSEDSERLMDWCFFNFEDVTLFAAGDVVDRVPVWLGADSTVPLVAGKDLVVTMPRNWRQKASIKISYDAPITAPVMKGDQVGKLVVSGDGVPNLSAPLFAAEDVARLGLPGRAIAVLSKYVTGT